MRYRQADARRTEILRAAARTGYVASAELAAVLGVSEMTVRRDIEKLAAEGALERVLGGAWLTEAARPAFGVREAQASDAKRAIARLTASLLCAGTMGLRPGTMGLRPGTIGLDAGTTVALVAPALPAHSWVVTHSVPVIEAVEQRDDLDLIVAGGVYQRTTRSFVGPAVLHALEGLALDVAVISVAAIDDGWLLGGDSLDAAVKRALIAAARRVLVVADASKIGARAPIRLARLDAVDDIVTDPAGAAALGDVGGAVGGGVGGGGPAVHIADLTPAGSPVDVGSIPAAAIP